MVTRGDVRARLALLGLLPTREEALLLYDEGPTALPRAEHAAWWCALRATLAEDGVAVVPIATLPGWHLWGAVRDFFAWHAHRQGCSLDDAAAEILGLPWGEIPGAEGPWPSWMSEVARQPEATWKRSVAHPVELRTAVADAARAGLTYLGDADWAVGATRTLTPMLRAFIEDEVRRSGDALRGEQIADYARNQHARLPMFGLRPASPPPDPVPVLRGCRFRRLEPAAVDECQAALVQDALDGEVRWQTLSDRTNLPEEELARSVVVLLELGTIRVSLGYENAPRRAR